MNQNKTEKKQFSFATKLILILLCIVILLLTAYIIFLIRKGPEPVTTGNLVVDINAKQQDTTQPEDELSGKLVYYAGIEDCVADKNTAVFLTNPKENESIYMVYEISVDDTVLFETGLIPPGEYIEWFPTEKLNPGNTYSVYMKETPYYINKAGEQIPLTAPTNVVQITITE